MKIVIIGAGVAGLTLGLACQRAGMDVRIFDKAKELRTIGGGILLWPHGLQFLDELGLSDCLRPAWMSVSCMNIVSSRGQNLMHEDSAELYSLLDGEILPIDRSQLQQMLISQLADNTLILDKTCMNVESRADYARVIFADGSEACADLVVGADGANSAVRHAIYPSAKPTYNGFCWWGGIVDSNIVPNLPVDEAHFILGQGKFCSIWPTQGNKFMWYLPVKMPLTAFTNVSDYQLMAESICADWNDDVQRIVAAPQVAQRFHLPIYELAPRKNSSTDCVTLIGDAAATTGPLLGQGANRAIEDAYLLSNLLQDDSQYLCQTLAYFDELRYARHQRVFELEQQSADALIQETPEALEFFESQIQYINLAMMYQDMIPLVNAKACAELRAATRVRQDNEAILGAVPA